MERKIKSPENVTQGYRIESDIKKKKEVRFSHMNHESDSFPFPSLLRRMHNCIIEERDVAMETEWGRGGSASASLHYYSLVKKKRANEESSGQQMQSANACTWIP